MNNKFFINLYNKIKKIYKKDSSKISKKSIVIAEYILDHNILNNNFTSSNIRDDIIKNIKYSYKIVYNNNILYYYSKTKTLDKYIIYIFQIINTLRILFNRNKSDNIQIVRYFKTNNRKLFPDTDKILSPNEINSGLTILSNNHDHNGEIILFRKEEILKVLIHELIHSNLIDNKLIFSQNVKNFSDKFCVNYNILLNEAYTEAIANILNIFFINIISKKSKKNLDVMFQNELKYSIYIYSKIMKYYNIDDINTVIKNDDKCKAIFQQKTNVFSYYFLKFILLLHLDELGSLLEKQKYLLKIDNEVSINKLIDLIIENLEDINKYFIKNINDKNNSLKLTFYQL